MKAKVILRVAYVIVVLAVLAWVGIGTAIWWAWREHREEVAASAAAKASTIAPSVPVPGDTFDRAISSVQYLTPEVLGADEQLPTWLSREVAIPANARSVGAWINFLRSEGATVCWRMALRPAGEADLTFAMPFEKASVRDVLDE